MKIQRYFANISDLQLNQKGWQTQDERIRIQKAETIGFNKMIAKGKMEVPAFWPIKRKKSQCVQIQGERGMELCVCVLESDLNWQPCKEEI